MASSLLYLLPLFSLLLRHPLCSAAVLPRKTHFRSELIPDPTSSNSDDSPAAFFEVTKPIQLPKTKPCSTHLLHHDFGYTYGKPPIFARYEPPFSCFSTDFDKIVLEFTAACKGRQFDRIFGVWLAGVELLRSCTAEPRATGIVWTVKKDVTRFIESTGWVKSSHGKIITSVSQEFNYSNVMIMGRTGNLQIVNQMIEFNHSVTAKSPRSSVQSIKSIKMFPFYLYSSNEDHGNGTYSSVANLVMGYNEERVGVIDSTTSVSSLENLQSGQGEMLVKGNLVVSGTGSTQQTYDYGDSKFCYFRDVSSSNYTILYDKEGNVCREKPLLFPTVSVIAS